MARAKARCRVPGYIRDYERRMPDRSGYLEEEFRISADGKATIDLADHEGMRWFDPMSCGAQADLDPEIYAYLDRRAFSIPAVYSLRIRILGCRLPEEDRRRAARMMREHYTLNLWEEDSNAKKNAFSTAGLAALGAGLLAAAFGIDRAVYGDVLSEMLMIVATFTFWEAADYFLLKRNAIKMQRLYAGQMATAEIVFDDGPVEGAPQGGRCVAASAMRDSAVGMQMLAINQLGSFTMMIILALQLL